MDIRATVLFFFVVVVQLTRARLLIGCDPRGELWVSAVDDSESEAIRRSTVVLREVNDNGGDNVTVTGKKRMRGRRYGTMSYDLFSDNILVELLNHDGSFHGLITIPACQPSAMSPTVAKVVPDAAVLEHVIIVDDYNPFLVACAGTGHDCGWSAFTYFYSVIYFLFVGQYGNSKASLVTRVEVRALTGCTDVLFPTDSVSPKTAKFAILNCSRIVATVLEAPPGDGWSLRAGKHMTVEPIDDSLHFFFQISRTKMSSSKDASDDEFTYNDVTDWGDEDNVTDWRDTREDEWDQLTLHTLDSDTPNRNKGNVAYVSERGTKTNKDGADNLTRSIERDRANRSESDVVNMFMYLSSSMQNITDVRGGNAGRGDSTTEDSANNSSAINNKVNNTDNENNNMAIRNVNNNMAIRKHRENEDNSSATVNNRDNANNSSVIAKHRDNDNNSSATPKHRDKENNSSAIVKHRDKEYNNSAITKHRDKDNNSSAIIKHRDKDNNSSAIVNNENNATTLAQNTKYSTSNIFKNNVTEDYPNISENTSMSIIMNTVKNERKNDTTYKKNKPIGNFVHVQTYSNSTSVDASVNKQNESTNSETNTAIPHSNVTLEYINTTSYVNIKNKTEYHASGNTTEKDTPKNYTNENNATHKERLYTVQTSLYRVTNIGRVDLLHIDVDRVNERTLPLRGYGGVSTQGM